jgi:hypothetical protein
MLSVRSTLLLLAASSLPLAPHAADRVPKPKFEVDKSTQCVAPPEEIRRTHPDLLKHRRDQTVRAGIRGGDVSLNACISCHASKTTGAVTGSADAFCQSCHTYAAVKLDCFECHQAQAPAKQSATLSESEIRSALMSSSPFKGEVGRGMGFRDARPNPIPTPTLPLTGRERGSAK